MVLFKRTPRGTTVLVLAAALVTMGVLQIGSIPILLVYVGIGLFLYYYTARLVFQVKVGALNRLRVDRIHPGQVTESQAVDVSTRLQNETFARLRVEVFDSFPGLFRVVNGSNAALVDVLGHGESTLQYRLKPTSIGKHEFGTMHLVIRDLAGLFFHERDIESFSTIRVVPQGRELARGSLVATRLLAFTGTPSSKRLGEAMEFAEIREYHPGDPFKRIEWKATARTGGLMVREHRAETQLNVMIVLDAGETMSYGVAGQTKLDYSTRAVSSLAAYLVGRGDMVGLTVVGQDKPKVVPLAKGQPQLNGIIHALSTLSPNPVTPAWVGLVNAARHALAYGRVKGRTLFIVISDLESMRSLETLRRLTRMGHEVVVVSPSTPLFEMPTLESLDATFYRLKTSVNWAERGKMVREAARSGIILFDAGPKDLFARVVLDIEARRLKGW